MISTTPPRPRGAPLILAATLALLAGCASVAPPYAHPVAADRDDRAAQAGQRSVTVGPDGPGVSCGGPACGAR